MNINELTVEELYSKIHSKEIKPSEVIEALFNRIEKYDGDIKAFITLTKEEATAKAEELDRMQAEDQMDQALFGVPFGIKDNIVTKDVLTTCASKMLHNFKPVYDATVMNKLNSENGIMLGKLNMDEFAMGSTSETSYYQTTKNPWNLNCSPGGSSGGSAAAVAAGFVPFALGTDTGGSVRQPASFCGVVGMKPTYGRVSRFGLIAFASSLDQIGPITRNVRDNAKVLELIAGEDTEHDMTSVQNQEIDFLSNIDEDVKGLKIALPKEFLGDDVDEEVTQAVLDAKKRFEDLGATVEEVEMPNLKYVVSSYYLIASSEASANLARFDGIRFGYRSENANTLEELYKKSRGEGFGDEVKRRILLGTYVLSAGHYDAFYVKAQKLRRLVADDVKRILKDHDLIIGPTSTTPAHKYDEVSIEGTKEYKNDILTIPANLTGIPSLSIPCGITEDNRPIGLQIMGNHFEENKIYNAAYQFEKVYNLHEELKNLTMGAE
mgnify:FL=1